MPTNRGRTSEEGRHDAKMYRELESRIARIEEDSKKKDKVICIVLQDYNRKQVSAESMSATVAMSGSGATGALASEASASGAHLKKLAKADL